MLKCRKSKSTVGIGTERSGMPGHETVGLRIWEIGFRDQCIRVCLRQRFKGSDVVRTYASKTDFRFLGNIVRNYAAYYCTPETGGSDKPVSTRHVSSKGISSRSLVSHLSIPWLDKLWVLGCWFRYTLEGMIPGCPVVLTLASCGKACLGHRSWRSSGLLWLPSWRSS